jgi:non-canonical poly(A) RNA polymerase PAPD5/7
MVDGGYIADKPQPDQQFSLLSPQDRDHDIGSASFKIRDVFTVFKNRYHFMTNYNFEPNESLLKHLVNPSNQIFTFIKQEDQD